MLNHDTQVFFKDLPKTTTHSLMKHLVFNQHPNKRASDKSLDYSRPDGCHDITCIRNCLTDITSDGLPNFLDVSEPCSLLNKLLVDLGCWKKALSVFVIIRLGRQIFSCTNHLHDPDCTDSVFEFFRLNLHLQELLDH